MIEVTSDVGHNGIGGLWQCGGVAVGAVGWRKEVRILPWTESMHPLFQAV